MWLQCYERRRNWLLARGFVPVWKVVGGLFKCWCSRRAGHSLIIFYWPPTAACESAVWGTEALLTASPTLGHKVIRMNSAQHCTFWHNPFEQWSADYGLFGACRYDFHHDPSAFSCRSRAVTCRADGGLGAGGAGGCSLTRSGSRRPALLSAELQKQPLTPPSLLLSGPPK